MILTFPLHRENKAESMNINTIAVIGSGNMGTSLIGGLLSDHYSADSILVSDPDLQKLNALHQRFQVHVTQNNHEAIKTANVIIFAVKPQQLLSVVLELTPQIQHKKPLLISIAAGITEHSLQHTVGGNMAIVRCMPNTIHLRLLVAALRLYLPTSMFLLSNVN
jgi:pyrroline-5-carboxylate reductase